MSTRPALKHDVRIIDTTLRDGSHAMAHQFTETRFATPSGPWMRRASRSSR